MGPPEGYDFDDWRDRPQPYRTMKQDEIKIPRRRWAPTFLVLVTTFAMGALVGAVGDNRHAKVRTITITTEVEKIVTVTVPAPAPKCLDKVFVVQHFQYFQYFQCDNVNHVLQYKIGDTAAICACKPKD